MSQSIYFICHLFYFHFYFFLFFLFLFFLSLWLFWLTALLLRYYYLSTLHKAEPYDPPTYTNSALFNAANRPDAKTPLAFHYHLRFGCASEVVLKQTQQHVCGMQVQKGSWKTLRSLLPCSACLAGKMRKQIHNTHARAYTDLNT